MALDILKSQAVAELAQALESFLPARPHPYADQTISFPAVAHRLGLSNYWFAGSKIVAVTRLLKETLAHQPSKLCPLVVEIIQTGMVYRANKGQVTREEITRINSALAKAGFRVPELADQRFLDSLPSSTPPEPDDFGPDLDQVSAQQLRVEFNVIAGLAPQQRGFAFERFLNQLFTVYRLAPRGSFRLVGEQVDGSFHFQGNTYLVEAKWQNNLTGSGDLVRFGGIVGSKSSWSRGVFVSYTGFSADGLQAFGRGRQTNLICVDGLDLFHILSGELDLADVISRKLRRAAETNEAFVPVRTLFPEKALV